MFSVVISVYNKAHAIERTLISVLSQSFKEFEVIVVNDGSTDNSSEVIKKFTNDPKVRIVNQKNMGVSAARNNGARVAKYDYIVFLDGDDEWMPGFLEIMKEAIEKFPQAGMLGSSSWHRDVRTGEGSDSTISRYKGKMQVVDYFENAYVMPHISATVVSKNIFNQVDSEGNGFPVEIKAGGGEDFACFFRIALISPVVYIGYPLGIRNNNVNGQVTSSSEEERFKLLSHIVKFYDLVFKCWVKTECKSKNYPIFLKYELRCRIINALRDKDYRTLKFLLENLNVDILKKFSKVELWFYRKKTLNILAKGYIYFTKIIWRTHGFPIVT